MTDDDFLDGKLSILSTSSMIFLVHHSGLIFHQFCIIHLQVMNQSCLNYASVIHQLRRDFLLSLHSAL